MSRDLPAHPNLEHLRKQAKELLRDLQQHDPDSQLADAQHAIAREYGFASWPKLRAHVESLPRPADAARAIVAPEEHPLVGTWTANLSKSKRHPDHGFQRATLRFAVAGDTVTITDVVVDAVGEQTCLNTLQTDGKEHPSEQSPRYAVVARWLGSHVLEAVGKKDGQMEGRVTYEVSADGKTMILSAGAAHSVDAEQVIVFDRAG